MTPRQPIPISRIRVDGGTQPRAALDLCRGDLLQELDDDWVVEAR